MPPARPPSRTAPPQPDAPGSRTLGDISPGTGTLTVVWNGNCLVSTFTNIRNTQAMNLCGPSVKTEEHNLCKDKAYAARYNAMQKRVHFPVHVVFFKC